MLLPLALTLSAFAQSLDASKAPIGQVFELPPLTATVPPARSLVDPQSTLWASGASVEVIDDGLLLDDELLVRFSSWGRGRHTSDVASVTPFLDCVPTPRDGGGCVVGPTWAHEGVDVWWAELDAGLELGWTVYEPPPGSGPLTLGVDLEGALLVRPHGEGAVVLSASRRQWSISQTVAWDADGVELPTMLREVEGGLEIVVDDSKANYPIVVDPTITTPRTTLTAAGAGQFGLSLVSGDFNADGGGDLAVGDPVTGTVRIYTGDRFFGGLSSTAFYTYTGANEFGFSLDVGDINGDGDDDLLIGSRGNEFAVVLGAAFTTPPIFRYGLPNGVNQGIDLATGFDVNGDGSDDVVIQDEVGTLHICGGRDTSPFVECTQTVTGIPAYSKLSAAEDFDGDGFGDFAIGAYTTQSLRLMFGSINGITVGPSYAASIFPGVTNTALFGYRLDGRGDLSGDGRNDLVVTNLTGNQVLLLTSISKTSLSHTLIGFGNSADYGSAVTVADYNGDGRDDLVVGLRDFSEVYAYPGHPTQLIDVNAPVVYSDTGGSSSFGDESLAVVNDDNRRAALIAVGSYSTNQVRVFDGWRDDDGDGYGPTDCNDSNAAIHPGATDTVGNEVDEDCNGTVSCYVDADDDDYRTNTIGQAPAFGTCYSTGFAFPNALLDCNDNNAAINPAATEITGTGVDENCDGSEVCYRDMDLDGRRSTTTGTTTSITCTASTWALANAVIDCNDQDRTVYPGATEVTANGIDNDCDGVEVCYQDLDNDGARTDLILVGGGPNTCTGAQQGLATDPIDCNDGNAAINPAATEVAGDGVDSNCNSAELCYVDSDRDGARSTSTVSSTTINCSLPDQGVAADPIDCNDTNNTIRPGATDGVADGVDGNCDGSETCYVDADQDGARSTTTRVSTSVTCALADLALAVDPLDCDDGSNTIFPGAAEGAGDGVDSDCDASEVCYVDADQDGARSNTTRSSTSLSCSQPDLALANEPVDCDDADDVVYPGAPEGTADGLDSDCDSMELCYLDADLDGARSNTTSLSASITCSTSGLALASASVDCDDADPFYAGTCPVFFLRAPTPGAAGTPNTIRIEGATPGARVVLLGGRSGTTRVPCGTFIDINGPTLISSGVADATGALTFTVTPPAALAGRTVVVQAAMPASCEVSSSYVWTL